jgi:predicted esterase
MLAFARLSRHVPLALLFFAATPTVAGAPILSVQPRPPAVAAPVPSGLIDLGGANFFYVPAGLDQTRPAPLLVLLHGAGGSATSMIHRLSGEADRRGIVLLGVKSRRYTWDAILAARGEAADNGLGIHAVQPFADDPVRIDNALAALFARVAIDPARIGLAGFSDGASYALAIGTANPRLFRAVIAFSPGLNLARRGLALGGQPVFVSHGRQDPVLPYRVSEGEISERLRANGAALTFRAFDGVHEVPDAVAAEAIAFFLAAPAAAVP